MTSELIESVNQLIQRKVDIAVEIVRLQEEEKYTSRTIQKLLRGDTISGVEIEYEIHDQVEDDNDIPEDSL